MALGGIILFLMQDLDAPPPAPPLFSSGSDFSLEFRVRFPLSSDQSLSPTQLSGALWTLSSGSSYVSAWYEKPSLSSTTGNLYVTSSAGRLTLASAPIFDDRFYNVSFVRGFLDQTMTLRVMRHDGGRLIYSTSSLGSAPATEVNYTNVTLGNSPLLPSLGDFWGHELRLWSSQLTERELEAHSLHFESYGREVSYNNRDLVVHWRLNDGGDADASGSLPIVDSTVNRSDGMATGFAASAGNFTKFLEDYSYIPSIEYGWNQEKVRVFSGSRIDPLDAYDDERFVTLELNMYDALNEDISHVMSSYGELGDVLGLPVNRYREDYEGLAQMRETYFKRLQGQLNFRVFADALDFFDTSFSSMVERLIPARSEFRGDELIVESHMLERPKYQYQLRPIIEGRIDISGSISVVDRGDDFD